MPATRRAFLATLTAMAGCADGPPESTASSTRRVTEAGTESATATAARTSESVPVRWRHGTPHDALDVVSLAGPATAGNAAFVGVGGTVYALDGSRTAQS